MDSNTHCLITRQATSEQIGCLIDTMYIAICNTELGEKILIDYNSKVQSPEQRIEAKRLKGLSSPMQATAEVSINIFTSNLNSICHNQQLLDLVNSKDFKTVIHGALQWGVVNYGPKSVKPVVMRAYEAIPRLNCITSEQFLSLHKAFLTLQEKGLRDISRNWEPLQKPTFEFLCRAAKTISQENFLSSIPNTLLANIPTDVVKNDMLNIYF
jgi:hypothetical protein